MKTLFLSYSAYSYILSVGIHTALLLGMGLSFTQEAQYGVRLDQARGMQVEWVTANSATASRMKNQDLLTTDEQVPDISLPEDTLSDVVHTAAQTSATLPQYQATESSLPSPALRASIPSKSATAPLKSAATKIPEDNGPIIRAQPHYLKNPPPVYPDAAREKRQQGLVVLSVIIGIDGNPAQIALVSSSGFSLLDEAARKAVRRWQFKPAKVGNVCVQSQADIPIRFELK